MNLHYDQSYEALIQLLRSAAHTLPSHYIAMDYDGEIIVDPDMHYPDVELSRYRYCTQLRTASLDNDRKVQTLHSRLLYSLMEISPITDTDYRAAA